MLRALLMLACVAAFVTSAAIDVSRDPFIALIKEVEALPFIALIKEVEALPFFQTSSDSYRLLTFEILTAAETSNLNPFFDKMGYIQLLKYLDMLPEDYVHKFITYSILHLEAEGVTNSTDLGYQP